MASCAAGHSFDRARSGYWNLLQPQDRKAKTPGDTAAAASARRRLHDLGHTQPLLQAIAALAAVQPGETLLDAGCGEGFFLGSLAHAASLHGPVTAIGIDLSQPAITAAAKRFPNCHWVIANADRQIPLLPATCSLILSITARRNPAEFLRILRPGGRLLVAIPAPDDLIEIRGARHPEKDRLARTIAEFSPAFNLLASQRATTQAQLSAEAVVDLWHSIYRPHQPQPPQAQSVTFSLDLLLFARA